MGSKNPNKKHESDSSESDASNSSRHSKSRKKSSRKHIHSSSEERDVPEKTKRRESSESDDGKYSKKKRRTSSSEETYDKKTKEQFKENRHHSRSRSREKHSENSKSKNYERDRERDRRYDDKKYDSGPSHRDRNDDRMRRDRRDDNKSKDRRDGRDSRDDRDSRDSRGNRDRRDNWNRKDNWNDRNGRRHKRSRSRSFDHANAKWGKNDEGSSKNEKKEQEEKQKPNFGLSGKLTEETNTYRGVVIKYSEPPEARKPKRRWRLYPFKGEKALQTLYIHRESAYLIGRERKVVDLPVDHPSCSKQHAALQYRLVPFTRDDGTVGKRVRPYLLDMDSANGTFINNKKIEPRKYVELLERDVIKFGFSSREYVLLHENSKDEAMDDDVKQEEPEEINIKEEPK